MRCLVRKTSDRARLPEGVEFAEGSLLDEDSLQRGVAGCAGVVHLAAVLKVRSNREFKVYNADATVQLGRIARAAGVERFVFCSSLAAAGPAPGVGRRRPKDQPQPITDYGKSKLAAEQALTAAAGAMRVTIIRPPAVYGPYDASFLTLVRSVNRGLRRTLGEGQKFSLIHGADLGEAFALALEADLPNGSVWFATDGVDHTDDELARTIAATLGRRAINLRAPLALARGVAALNELRGRLTGRAVFLNRQKIRELTQPNYTCDDAAFRAATGFANKWDLAGGMRQTIDWYKRKGWL